MTEVREFKLICDQCGKVWEGLLDVTTTMAWHRPSEVYSHPILPEDWRVVCHSGGYYVGPTFGTSPLEPTRRESLFCSNECEEADRPHVDERLVGTVYFDTGVEHGISLAEAMKRRPLR
jgi:hypothetical protein